MSLRYQVVLKERIAKYWASETERAAMVIQAAWKALLARRQDTINARAARVIQLGWRIKRRRLRAAHSMVAADQILAYPLRARQDLGARVLFVDCMEEAGGLTWPQYSISHAVGARSLVRCV
eukprot:COSAG05_NODE_3517_length_2014_cov_7.247515_3_plen_122_part_00